jgi:hypothetical protein
VARLVWRALDGEVLLRHVKTAGYVGAAALRHDLARRRGVSWGAVRNGVAEIDGFGAELLEAFSTRRGELTAEFTQLVEEGFAADAATMTAAQRGTRAAKRVLSDPQVEAIQAAKLTDAGWTIERVRALATGRARRPSSPTPAQVKALFDDLTGPGGLTEHQAVFGHREVTQAIAAWAGDRLDAETIAGLVQKFLADPRIVLLSGQRHRRRNQDEDTYTTSELLQVEASLIGLYEQGRTDHGGPPRARIETSVVDAAIAAVDQRLRAEHPVEDDADSADQADRGDTGLSDEQDALVRGLLAGGDLVRAVIGPAGTGKTEAMRVLVHAFTAAGYTVLGTANGGRQAQDLAERLGVQARVVTGWLTLLDHAPQPAQVWGPGTVLIVDEATQVSTRHAQRLLRLATGTSTVVILVGDPVQLGSVGAGGWFRHLVDVTPDVPGLSINQRQRGRQMLQVRQALAGLREHTPRSDQEALRRLAADGRVAVFENREDMLNQIVTDWYTERRTHPPGGGRSRMMAEHHRDTDLLNHAARERLTADATLSGPLLRVAGRDFQTGDEVITLTQAGHTLIPAGRPRSEYIRTGTIGTVTAVHLDPDHPAGQHLSVTFPGRGDVHVDWAYLTHAFPDGRDGGLAHAYAHTGHKAEGSTMATARALIGDDTSRAGLYVMLSRGREDLRAYVIRRRDLHADLDDEDWLPVLDTSIGPLRALLEHLEQTGPQRLAGELDPIAHAAYHLTSQQTLADLTRLRHTATRAFHAAVTAGADTADAGRDLLIVRRAEIAAETTVGHAGLAAPSPRLLARLGPRPVTGSDRQVWDRAVTALARFHARHHPPCPPEELPTTAPDTDQEPELEWQNDRARAEQLADQWAQHLDAHQQARFRSRQETIPRQRAIVALHALLSHGWTPQRISTALTADPFDGIRAPAAVLEYRTRTLLETTGIDPAFYDLPPAPPAVREWEHATALLNAVQARHLAHRATGDLAAEHRNLTRFLTSTPTQQALEEDARRVADRAARDDVLAAAGRLQDAQRVLDLTRARLRSSRNTVEHAHHDVERARQDLADRQHTAELTSTWLTATAVRSDTPAEPVATALTVLRAHLSLVDAALAHQIDHAALQLAQEPAPYLTGLLGHRPTDPAAGAVWHRRAVAVEHYRHHTLGLPYGHPAAPTTAAASEQALGPPPADPLARVIYERTRADQPTLDLGTHL